MGAKEVAAGAAWLDENASGWERKIDLANLDIQDCHRCIIGQSISLAVARGLGLTLNRYGTVWGALYDFKGIDWVREYAFAGEENEPLWVELIKERFSTGNLSDDS